MQACFSMVADAQGSGHVRPFVVAQGGSSERAQGARQWRACKGAVLAP